MVSLISSGHAVYLPSPELEDTFSLTNTVDIKRTMLGDVYIYVKQNKFTHFKLTFSLNRIEANALGKFYIDNCQNPVTYRNWFGQTFKGFITVSPLEITENRKWDNKVEVEFQGLKIS